MTNKKIKNFNQKYPIGTKVAYFRTLRDTEFTEAKTTSEAYDMYGTPMIMLDIGGGCRCLDNIKVRTN